MKLEASVGTLKIVCENEKDLLVKLLKEKEAHEKQATQIQADWEKTEKAYKEKIRPIRRNLAALEDAIQDIQKNSPGAADQS